MVAEAYHLGDMLLMVVIDYCTVSTWFARKEGGGTE